MTVLNKHKLKGGVIPAGAVYIGRGSKWGNPFVMPQHGNRDEVCDKHKQHLKQQVESGAVTVNELAALQGKDLVCFCAPLRCHGDALMEAAEWATNELRKPASTEIKLIVAGSRDFNDYALLSETLNEMANGVYADKEVSIVSGMARGADAMAAHFARENGVVLYECPADWDRLGKGAGFARNAQMARDSDALLAFWDGRSPGTAHMIKTMTNMGKDVRVVKYVVGQIS